MLGLSLLLLIQPRLALAASERAPIPGLPAIVVNPGGAAPSYQIVPTRDNPVTITDSRGEILAVVPAAAQAVPQADIQAAAAERAAQAPAAAAAQGSLDHIHHDPQRASELNKLFDGWGWKASSMHAEAVPEAPAAGARKGGYGLAKAPALVSSVRARGLLLEQALGLAQARLHRILEGNGAERGKWLTTRQRLDYFRSPQFKDYAAAARAAGQRLYFLRDQDKSQAAGDVFTAFFEWRADHGTFTPEQGRILRSFLESLVAAKTLAPEDIAGAAPDDASANAKLIVELWRRQERRERALKAGQAGAESLPKGIDLLTFWSGAYWPSQKGLTRKQKQALVAAYAPEYKRKIYPRVAQENKALRDAGVDVVVVSNGDEELSKAVARRLGVGKLNVTGSRLAYDAKGLATGVIHTYEIQDPAWQSQPQPGKALLFKRWLYENRWRGVDAEAWRLVGMDGDSAGPDMGPMMYLGALDIGGFMADTPGEPWRLELFRQTVARSGFADKDRFIRVVPEESPAGPLDP